MKRRIQYGRRSSASGFTLVEVLLTLLIMGGIMLSMTQILTAARTSRDTIHNIQETQRAGPAIMDMIERDLRGITTFDRTRALHLRVKNRVMLGFDCDSLDFVTATRSLSLHAEDDRFVRAADNEVGYRMRQSTGSDQFLEIWRRESYGVDEDPFEGGTYLFLCDRVKGFEIKCFEKDGPEEDPIDEWGSQKNDEHIGLPARVEITLTLELAPRLVNEQLRIAPIDRRTVTYKRVIRLPEMLRVEEDKIPIAAIPETPKPTAGQNPAANTAPTQPSGLPVADGTSNSGNHPSGGTPFGQPKDH